MKESISKRKTSKSGTGSACERGPVRKIWRDLRPWQSPLIVAAAFTAITAVAQEHDTTDGATLYRNNCAACHGMVGEGDGPVASAMRVTMPNLRTLASRNSGEFPHEAVAAYVDGRNVVAAHGDRQMPVWGDVFSAGDDPHYSDAIVAHRIGALMEYLSLLQYRD